MRYCFGLRVQDARDDGAEIEDADQIRELLDLDNPAGAIGHAIKVASDRDEAVVADTCSAL